MSPLPPEGTVSGPSLNTNVITRKKFTKATIDTVYTQEDIDKAGKEGAEATDLLKERYIMLLCGTNTTPVVSSRSAIYLELMPLTISLHFILSRCAKRHDAKVLRWQIQNSSEVSQRCLDQ